MTIAQATAASLAQLTSDLDLDFDDLDDPALDDYVLVMDEDAVTWAYFGDGSRAPFVPLTA